MVLKQIVSMHFAQLKLYNILKNKYFFRQKALKKVTLISVNSNNKCNGTLIVDIIKEHLIRCCKP